MSTTGLLALRASDGATVTLERFPILLGRSVAGGAVPDVDVSHLDPERAVDNRHVELTRVPAGLEVHDLGGLGGSWVDGRRLAPGARALLEVGGALRVGAVTLTLVDASELMPGQSARGGAPEGEGGWLRQGPAQGVPPPPSAGGQLPEPEARRDAELDLSGAPALAREALEQGAELVRIRPGAQLETLKGREWTAHGKPLSPGAVQDAVGAVRRVLELPEEVLSGEGHVGDVALEFLLPPLTDRPYLAVRIAPRASARLDPEELALARQAVLGGAALLVAGPWPEPALAALAEHFEATFANTRVLSFGSADWWVPPGWANLDPYHPAAVQEALRTGELFLDQPPEPILEALLTALPRAEGGTVLSLRRHSLLGTLEQLARELQASPPAPARPGDREELARLIPLALSWQGHLWSFCRVGVDHEGRWASWPLEAGRELS